MALPKPVNTLGNGFRVLVDDEVDEIINNYKMGEETETPPSYLFTIDQLKSMSNGQIIFLWFKDEMLAVGENHRDAKLVAYKMEKRVKKPTQLVAYKLEKRVNKPTLRAKIRSFFNGCRKIFTGKR